MEKQLYLYVASSTKKKIQKYESKALKNVILSTLHQKQEMTY
jgi:hypothetical protein